MDNLLAAFGFLMSTICIGITFIFAALAFLSIIDEWDKTH